MSEIVDILINSEEFNKIINSHEILFLNKISFIEDNGLKENLIKILKYRLNGVIPDFLPLDDNYSGFDWEKGIDLDSVEYLNDFNKYYFSENYLEQIDENFTNNTILPTINQIKEASDLIKTLNENEIINPKKIIIQLYELGEKFHKSKINLEYIFILKKLKNFLKSILLIYPNLVALDSILNNLKKPVSFKEFIDLFFIEIKNCMRKSIQQLIENFNPDSESKNKLYVELLNLKKKINSLFWIIYSDDINYVESIFKVYVLDEESLENIQTKLDSFENYSEEFSKLIDKLEIIKEKFMIFVKKYIRSLPDYKLLSTNEISDIIDAQIKNIISDISDLDDKTITKNSLEECKDFVQLDINLDKTFDVLSKFIK